MFLLNATKSVVSAILISRWQRKTVISPLGRERLWMAMRVGLQYVGQSYHVKGLILRISIFF